MYSSCETNKERTEFKKSVYFYPDLSYYQNDSLFVNISLDSVFNYGELFEMADQIACNGKSPVIQFSNDQEDFNLLVFKDCSKFIDPINLWLRDLIFFERDYIIVNDQIKKPLDSLSSILENHILNPYNKKEYSRDKEKAIIYYYQDSLCPIDKIKNQFIKIVTEFNQLNKKRGDSLPLKIKLSEHPYYPHSE